MDIGITDDSEKESNPHGCDLRRTGLRSGAGYETAGQRTMRCVRGANAPENQCVLAGEFAVGSRSWQWALANRTADGNLPSGRVIARAHGRKERWGRLVKNAGQQRVFGSAATSGTSPGGDKMREVAAAGPDGAR